MCLLLLAFVFCFPLTAEHTRIYLYHLPTLAYVRCCPRVCQPGPARRPRLAQYHSSFFLFYFFFSFYANKGEEEEEELSPLHQSRASIVVLHHFSGPLIPPPSFTHPTSTPFTHITPSPPPSTPAPLPHPLHPLAPNLDPSRP